ncbi:MFS transporter [Micromonospora sp. NRRL B-16802]|uniref:MFS transporter n=1 Tax=Micromonospora sp. NRRL B-16802 TaxID=1415541 RepID=UPI0009EB692E|nr:MFS transporter [Micromonospora sp. NRRL B-16802]
MTNVEAEPSAVRSDALPASGIRTYIILWISQWLACAAVSFTVFVISVNIFVDFSAVWIVAAAYAVLFVPFPILSPFAGAFVDRYGQRPALLISNIGTLLNLSILAYMMISGLGTPFYAVCAVGISTILRTLQLAAIESVVPLLVPKRHYGRANGPRMLLTGTFVLAGPLLAYLLLSVFAPSTIVIAECVLVVIAIIVVSRIQFPGVDRPSPEATTQSLGRDVADAYRTLRARRGLLTMVGFLAIVSGVLGALEVAASGTVLGFADDSGAIAVSTSCWLGMVVASILMVVWGVPRKLVMGGLLGAGLVFAVALVAAAVRPNLILLCVGGFIAMGSLAVVIATFQTVMHLKVEQRYLGRAVGLKNTAVTMSHIVGDVGTLVLGISIFANSGKDSGGGVWGWRQGHGWDDVDSPFLKVIIGDGPGRGWALFMMLIGLGVGAVVAYLRYRKPALLHVEDDLPDVTPMDRLSRPTEDLTPVRASEATATPGGRSA